MNDKEEYLISSLKSKYIGDDGAVVGDYIYSMDAFFEDSHFKREWMSFKEIGVKAMLVNISDAIAMNAKPLYALVTVSIPKDIDKKDIDNLLNGLQDGAKNYGCEIIGGDTIGGDKLHISITIVSKSNNPLLRKGVKEGDLLAFTGTLGESKRDLNRLFKGEKIESSSRFLKPTLREKFIKEAREFLNAGMDISDGLFCDTNKLLKINNLYPKLIEKIDYEIGSSAEEYEMLIAFSPKNKESILEISSKTDTKITIFAIASLKKEQLQCKSHHF